MKSEKEWLEQQVQQEEKVLADSEASFNDLLSKLMPKIRAKALENDLTSDVNVTINFDFKNNPRVTASGFVPPIILKCQKF
jgi:hypothetical protein